MIHQRESRQFCMDYNRIIVLGVFSLILCSSAAIIGSKGMLLDLIALVGLAVFVYAIYSVLPEMFLKYFHFIIMSAWSVLAVFILENGDVYLRGNYSEHFGSFPIYALAWDVFYFVLAILELRKKRNIIYSTERTNSHNININIKKDNDNFVLYISYIAIFILIACFVGVAFRPYFIVGLDRFAYSQTQTPSYVSLLFPFLYCFIPVVLMVRKQHKFIPIFYTFIFALLCVWMGEKFSGLIRIIFFVTISLTPEFVGDALKRKIKFFVKAGMIMVASLLILVVVQQIVLYSYDSTGLFAYFEDRLAAEGELWWLTYKQDSSSGLHLDELRDEVSIWINQPSGNMIDYNFGIYKLMKKFMNTSWVNSALSEGVRATESSRASLYYYGKAPGLIIGQILFALLVYLLINKLNEASNRHNWILAFLYIYFLQNVISAVYMSDIQLLTTKRMLLVYMLLFVFSKFKIKFGEIVLYKKNVLKSNLNAEGGCNV